LRFDPKLASINRVADANEVPPPHCGRGGQIDALMLARFNKSTA
jgi:hypothetical protein